MKYLVKIIHEIEIEADDEEQAIDIAISKDYGEYRDCYFNVEEVE